MMYQVGWTRTFALLFGSSVYTFSLIVAIFIGGLSLGSFIISVVMAHVKNSKLLLGSIEVLTGVAGLGITCFLKWAPVAAMSIHKISADSFVTATLVKAVSIGLICLLPTILMGAVIPLAAAVIAKKSPEPASAIGKLYSANTTGCIVGALGAGFLTVPHLGLRNTLIIGASINIFAGVYYLYKRVNVRDFSHSFFPVAAKIKPVFVPTVTIATIIVTLAIPTWDQSMLTSGSYLYSSLYSSISSEKELDYSTAVRSTGKIVYNAAGEYGVITVREIENENLVLQINGKADASTGKDMKTQLLLGHLPALMAQKRERMLVVGLGSGATLGAMQMYTKDNEKPIDCVEICREIVDASTLFQKHTGHSLKEDKVNLIEDDGRTFLTYTDNVYDVIVSEPSNPWISGMTNLFTREYFDLCSRKLDEQGLMCQWVQGYNMSKSDFASIVKSFHSVFGRTTIWKSDGEYDYILLGHKSASPVDVQGVKELMQNPHIRSSLEGAGISSATDLLGLFIGGNSTALEIAKSGKLITDDNLLLEYSAPQSLFDGQSRKNISIALAKASNVSELTTVASGSEPMIIASAGSSVEKIEHIMENVKTSLENGDTLKGLHYLYEAMKIAPGSLQLRTTTEHLLCAMGKQSLSDNDFESAGSYFQEALKLNPSGSEIHNYLGNCTMLSGDNDTALYHYAMAVHYKKDNIGALTNLAVLTAKMGKLEESINAYEKLIENGVEDSSIYNNLALLYAKTKDSAKAKETWQMALKVDPLCKAARMNLGRLDQMSNAG